MKTKTIETGILSWFKKTYKRSKKASVAVLIFGLVLSPLMYISFEQRAHISKLLISYYEVMPFYIESLVSEQETISIDMKHINVQKIEFMRQRALLDEKQFEYVPAVIRSKDKNIKIKIRLKGDRKIHFDNMDTASYRIKVKGGNTLFGMKTFSIHKPRARNHLYEWVYLRLMQYEGVMAPQYKLVKVNLNGKDLGLYAIEEHYDKYLIERHNKREGPIVRFKEANVNRNHKYISKYEERPVVPYVTKKWQKQENLSITKKAVYLLEGFRRGKLTASETFDVEKLAMFFALTDLTGTHHGTVPKSLRFYYNPITSKLEPVPFDGHFGTVQKPMLTSEMGITPSSWIYVYWKEFYISFFNDPARLDIEFIRAYTRALEKVSSPDYLDNFFDDIKDELIQAIVTTYSELPLKDNIGSFGPEIFKFDKNVYYKRSKYIAEKLKEPTVFAHLVKRDGKKIIIEINNVSRHLPLELLSLNCNGMFLKPGANFKYIMGVSPLTDKEIHKVEFPLNENNLNTIDISECKNLTYRYVGIEKVSKIDVYTWPSYDHEFVKKDITRSTANYSKFKFIKEDPSKKTLTISVGNHVVSENLIFPNGYTVVAEPGVTLELKNSAMIYSRSALLFEGTKLKPIKIFSKDGTGQGIAVIGALMTSVLKNVELTNLRNPNQLGWTIPGAITFYESPIEMNSVIVNGNKSEDAINIVRSNFNIRALNVSNSAADALDVDFSKGSIYDSQFYNVGNDGIDVSGTEIHIEKIEITKSGDKGISAGEQSNLTAIDVILKDNMIGVASKDKSTVHMTNLDVRNTDIAIVAYQKKSEFGSAEIEIDGFIYDGYGVKSLIEKGSMLIVNGTKFVGELTDVESWVLNISESHNEKLQ